MLDVGVIVSDRYEIVGCVGSVEWRMYTKRKIIN